MPNNKTMYFGSRSNGGNIPSSSALPSALATKNRSMSTLEGHPCATSASEEDPMSTQTSTSDLVSETAKHVSESESDASIA